MQESIKFSGAEANVVVHATEDKDRILAAIQSQLNLPADSFIESMADGHYKNKILRIDGVQDFFYGSQNTRFGRPIINQLGHSIGSFYGFERLGLREDGKVRGRFRATGIRPKCSDRLAASGITLPANMFEHMHLVPQPAQAGARKGMR